MIAQFMYRNHHGKTEVRRVEIKSISFEFSPGFDYQPGWFITGWDQDRDANRTFALCNIIVEDADKDGMYQLFVIKG